MRWGPRGDEIAASLIFNGPPRKYRILNDYLARHDVQRISSVDSVEHEIVSERLFGNDLGIKQAQLGGVGEHDRYY